MWTCAKMRTLFLSAALFLSVFGESLSEIEITRTCEPIRIDICKGIGYNVTGMPNFVGHDLQQDAALQLQTFMPLIQYGCSSRLRLFLCSVYVPMCTDKVPQSIGPCRSLCESVQDLCEPVLIEFGFLWPPALNCSQFPPENNEKHMCMKGPDHEEHPASNRKQIINSSISRTGPGHRSRYNNVGRPKTPPPPTHHICKNLRYSDHYYFVNTTGRCAASCSADVLYSRENKEFAQLWVAVWASLCFLSSLFTLVSFFADSSTFRYPERIIVIISGCYFVCSVAYIVRLVASRDEVACYADHLQYPEPLLIHGGLDNCNCTVVFLLLYFFGMASSVWWVVLSLNWFLTSGLRWSPETLAKYSSYFHLVAWAIPGVQTVTVWVLQKVDADELTGTCYVGNQDQQTLMHFVIVPNFAYLVIGVVFLISGMALVLRNKRKHGHLVPSTEKTNDKLEVLLVRIGIFALLYTIPAGCVLMANFYEYCSREQWLFVNSDLRPNVEIFTVKIFMSLVVGITTGVWLWTSRTPFTLCHNVAKRCSTKHPPVATVPTYQIPKRLIVVEALPHKIRVNGNVTIV